MDFLGRIICDLPPAQGNPRNSEGAFLTLKNGEIVFIYSAFRGESGADHAVADLRLLRSVDGGHSFADEGVILTCEADQGVNMMSVSLLEMGNGDIGLFYLLRTTYTEMQMYLRRSSDGGHTWGDRVCCIPRAGYHVVNNDRVVRLSDGRILIPAAFHRASPAPDGNFILDSRGEIVWFCSDDDGLSFRELPGKSAIPSFTHCLSGLQEPGVVELAPNCLWGWARTDLGRQYEMFSLDNGESWTLPQPSMFTSPCSPLSMKRLPDTRLCAVWNPIPGYNGKEESPGGVWTGGRSPFVLAVSKDNGRSFSSPMIVEEDPGSGFCYCAIHPVLDGVLLAYCAGGQEDGSCLHRLRIRFLLWKEIS